MANVVRQDYVRRQNQFGILSVLRRNGPLSRTAISALTGLSPSTVTVITNNLIERGVLTDRLPEEVSANKRGRPQVRLAPSESYAAIGILRLARGIIEGVLYDYVGKEMARQERRQNTVVLNADGVIRLMVDIVADMMKGRCDKLAHLTVAVEGIVDSEGRRLLSTPVADVHDVDFASALEAAFNAPSEIMNDCNAVAEGLIWSVPDTSTENFAAILMSMGVGLGLAINGHMISGPKSSGMEFGHMIYKPDGALCRCGRHGCIEAYAGIYGIHRAAQGGDPNALPAEEPPEAVLTALIEQAEAGDPATLAAFHDAGRAIGTGLVNLFTLFDNVRLILAGPSTSALAFMREGIRQALANRSFGRETEPDFVDIYPDSARLMREGALIRSLIEVDMAIPDQTEQATVS